MPFIPTQLLTVGSPVVGDKSLLIPGQMRREQQSAVSVSEELRGREGQNSWVSELISAWSC